MTPLVSVVIPTYNYGHLLADAVESALGQTYPAVEVVVVDDGSTDDTPARLAAFGDRIRVIRQPNAGLSAARNTGIAATTGKYVALLDSDDAFHPRKIEIQMALFADRPAVGVVGSRSFSDEPVRWDDLPSGPPGVDALTLDEVVMGSPFPPSSAVVRAECFTTIGLFDTSLRSAEDRDMWIRIATQFPLVRVSAPLTWYRQTPGSMSKNAENMETAERVVIDKSFALPELQGRWAFRRRVLALAAYSSAYRFLSAGKPWAGAWRGLRSFSWWPGPLAGVRYRFGRVRLLASCVLVYLRPATG